VTSLAPPFLPRPPFAGFVLCFENIKVARCLSLFDKLIVSQMQRNAFRTYPFVFASAFSAEASTALNEASGSGIVPMSRILRSAVDLWRANHRWLMQQGYSSLEATRRLLDQTDKPAQAQPQAQPSGQPFPPPFAEPQMNGGPHARL
jgi:hypothetical protein